MNKMRFKVFKSIGSFALSAMFLFSAKANLAFASREDVQIFIVQVQSVSEVMESIRLYFNEDGSLKNLPEMISKLEEVTSGLNKIVLDYSTLSKETLLKIWRFVPSFTTSVQHLLKLIDKLKDSQTTNQPITKNAKLEFVNYFLDIFWGKFDTALANYDREKFGRYKDTHEEWITDLNNRINCSQ
jgi:hypothetical protein